MDFYSQKNNLNQRKASGTGSQIPELKGIKKNGFDKYEDPTGMFSNKQLRFSAWYVKNRMLLYRILVIVLILFSAVTLIYSLLRIAWIFIVEAPRDNKSLEQLTQFEDYNRLNKILMPKPLLIGEIQVFSAGVEKYDAMTEITNQNLKHIVYFDYYFEINGIITEKKSGFLLPQETKLFTDFGLNDGYGANLVVDNISFKRINAHVYSDPINFILVRNLFSVSNFEFKSVLHPEGANANIIKFDLINDSPFNYYDANFIVEFRNGGGTVGIAEINLANLASLEKRSIDLRSFADNLFVDEIFIYPSINYFEYNSYFEPVR
ncbi:MAG: hypothetical protein Q7J14_00065 [Candidatus Magasanikbacteria bacterium]|nr:hypothetical protein [Candidatus Magasanikbacteria bacterium]